MIAEHLEALGMQAKRAQSCEKTLLEYMQLVLEANERINLTSVTDEEEFILRHLLDSLSTYGMRELASSSAVCDVGTGAGFPGIPLAVAYPEKRFVLIDSLAKRVECIRCACKALAIENVQVLHMRAEEAGRDESLRESFDLVVSRALAAMPVLLEYTIPLLQTGGSLFAYKTKSALPEIETADMALRLLGAAGEVEIRTPQDPTHANKGASGFRIFVVQKQMTTPGTYPRRAGVPAKVPL